MRCGTHSGRIEVKRGLAAVAAAGSAYRSVWESACKHDGIPPESKFVEFSDENPFVQFLAPALQAYQEAKSGYVAGGYVGLTLT